jgi:hypothetical protein
MGERLSEDDGKRGPGKDKRRENKVKLERVVLLEVLRLSVDKGMCTHLASVSLQKGTTVSARSRLTGVQTRRDEPLCRLGGRRRSLRLREQRRTEIQKLSSALD